MIFFLEKKKKQSRPWC